MVWCERMESHDLMPVLTHLQSCRVPPQVGLQKFTGEAGDGITNISFEGQVQCISHKLTLTYNQPNLCTNVGDGN